MYEIHRKTDDGDILTVIDHQYGAEIDTLWASCKMDDENLETADALTKILQTFRYILFLFTLLLRKAYRTLESPLVVHTTKLPLDIFPLLLSGISFYRRVLFSHLQ